MKRQDLNELKNKSIQELKKRLLDLEKEKINSQIELKMGKNQNVHIVSQHRKDIAKIKTILRMKLLVETQNQKDEKGENGTN